MGISSLPRTCLGHCVFCCLEGFAQLWQGKYLNFDVFWLKIHYWYLHVTFRVRFIHCLIRFFICERKFNCFLAIYEIFKHQFCENSNCLQRMTQEVIDISKLIRLHGVLFHFYISAFKLLKNNSLPPLYLSQNLSEFFILDTDLWLCLSAFW